MIRNHEHGCLLLLSELLLLILFNLFLDRIGVFFQLVLFCTQDRRKMDIKNIKSIIKADTDCSADSLKTFIDNAEGLFIFPELDVDNLRQNLWNSLYNLANTSSEEEIQACCFSAIRILSREKKLLDHLVKVTDWLSVIKRSCGLDDIQYEFTEKNKIVAIEAEKCLCNLVFNSTNVAKECFNNGILYSINDRLKLYKHPSFPPEIKFFDIKLMFIITALRPESRKPLTDEKCAVIHLIEVLRSTIQDTSRENKMVSSLNNESVDLACETLKALFNLTLHLSNDEEGTYNELVNILGYYLLVSINSKEKRFILHNNVINLLTNMPNQCYSELMPKIGSTQFQRQSEYKGHNVACLKEILELLKLKVTNDGTVSEQHEIISPIATVLYKGACANKNIRKYLRSEILPPLKDVYNRPEEGTTLRNSLCRLLTTPITQLRDIVAEFLFILCKKSVNRMIKYTGYGNAAGLFAQRGLLGGGEDKEAADFSSDSENSETEEYAEHKHEINPVLGCYGPPQADAMADMTEEQKEYEAMKLVQLMDTLTKSGTIKPCRVGKDGKPEPIDHVLQLQENMKNQ